VLYKKTKKGDARDTGKETGSRTFLLFQFFKAEEGKGEETETKKTGEPHTLNTLGVPEYSTAFWGVTRKKRKWLAGRGSNKRIGGEVDKQCCGE